MVVFKFVKTCVSIHHVIALFQVVSIVAISDGQLMTHKYRGSQQSSREVKPNLLIRYKGRQRTLGSLNNGVVNSVAPGNRLARKGLSVVTVL